jgi:hypothetical protein
MLPLFMMLFALCLIIGNLRWQAGGKSFVLFQAFVGLPWLVYAMWGWYETGSMVSSLAILLLAGQWTTRRIIDLRTKDDRQPFPG